MSFLDGFRKALSDVNTLRQKCHKCQKSEIEGEKGIFGNIGNFVSIPSTGEEVRTDSDEPDPAALAHARRLLVTCPVQGRILHCWYCSRCSEAGKCSAWRSRRSDVEFFRQSGKPYSLYLVEEMEAEGVLQ